MANFTIEAKRVKAGQSLTDMYSQGMSAVSQLKGIKTNILALKAEATSDVDFTEDDVAEVQAKIVELATEIQSILS